jgi:hypothetical protein
MCNAEIAMIRSKIGKRQTWNHSKAEKILGMTFKDPYQSAVEMAEQIIKDGY